MRKNLLFCLILILVSLLAYSNSFYNSFHYDDAHVIVRNPFIKNLAYVSQFFSQPQLGSGVVAETSSYRPLLLASFALNYYLGGLNVFGYHLVNFLLHAICAILVYFLLLSSFYGFQTPKDTNALQYQWMALFGSLIFALHPVQTESVTYITGRSSLLTALFFLGSFLLYVSHIQNTKGRDLIFSLFLFAAALLVKEIAITLIALLCIFNLTFPQGRTLINRFISVVPYLLLSILYLFVRYYFFGSLQSSAPPARALYDHIISQPSAWVHYLALWVLPLNLNVDYDFPVSQSLLENGVILYIGLLTAISFVVWRLSRSNRLVGFFALWFALILLPTNSFLILEDLVCDRWLYLPSIGCVGLMTLSVNWIFQKCFEGGGRAGKIVFIFLCALIVEVYGFGTLLRNFTWATERTLWEDAVRKSPNKARANDALGIALTVEGRLEEAREHLQKAITLAPEAWQPYSNLAYVYMNQGKWEDALGMYQKALSLKPLFISEIYNNLGLVYFGLGRMEEGEKILRKAIVARPYHAAPYSNLGTYFEKKGDIDQAIYFYEMTVKLAPESYQCYVALSVLYKRKGWEEKSVAAYKKFLNGPPR